MLILDKAKVKSILTTEMGYTSTEADLYLNDYPPIHDELAVAVNRWLEDRVVLDVSVHGLSITEVMQVQRCHFLMAVYYLNSLLDGDLTEEQRERLIGTLRKPFPRR